MHVAGEELTPTVDREGSRSRLLESVAPTKFCHFQNFDSGVQVGSAESIFSIDMRLG